MLKLENQGPRTLSLNHMLSRFTGKVQIPPVLIPRPNGPVAKPHLSRATTYDCAGLLAVHISRATIQVDGWDPAEDLERWRK